MKTLFLLSLAILTYQARANDLGQSYLRCSIRSTSEGSPSTTKTYRGDMHIGLRDNGPISLRIKSFVFSDPTIASYEILARSYQLNNGIITAAEVKREKGVVWRKALAVSSRAVSLHFSRESLDRRAPDYLPRGTSSITCELNESLNIQEINRTIQENAVRSASSSRRVRTQSSNSLGISSQALIDEMNAKKTPGASAPRRR